MDTHFNCSDFDEDKFTKEYMAKHGIDNVRGGTYCQMDLDAATKQLLLREIRGARDVCLRCGREGHFVAQCFVQTHVDGSAIVTASSLSSSGPKKASAVLGKRKAPEPVRKVSKPIHQHKTREGNDMGGGRQGTCHRCGKAGHWANSGQNDKRPTES